MQRVESGTYPRPHRREPDEDAMGPDINYVVLAEKIKKPRRAILTRQEFLILALLYEANRAMRYTELAQELINLNAGVSSVNILTQLKELEEMRCLRRLDDKSYVLSFKGREILKAAATLIDLLDSKLY